MHEKLYTPYGLRSLSVDDPNYIGQYNGNGIERDRAYHNGTVWPWLISFYTQALLRYATSKRETKKTIKEVITHFKAHLGESGSGFISEIFSGDYPHEAHGCIAQAWSVSECLRLDEMLKKSTYYK